MVYKRTRISNRRCTPVDKHCETEWSVQNCNAIYITSLPFSVRLNLFVLTTLTIPFALYKERHSSIPHQPSVNHNLGPNLRLSTRPNNRVDLEQRSLDKFLVQSTAYPQNVLRVHCTSAWGIPDSFLLLWRSIYICITSSYSSCPLFTFFLKPLLLNCSAFHSHYSSSKG